MKITKILNCLMLMIPFAAFAHPGHESAAVAAALSSGQLWSLAALTGLMLGCAAAVLWRRRKSVRADD